MDGSAFSGSQSFFDQLGRIYIPVDLQNRFNLQARLPEGLGQPAYASLDIPNMASANGNPFHANYMAHSHYPQDESVAVNLDSASGFTLEANANGLPGQGMQDENQNMENGFNEHGHTHEHSQNTIRPEWKLLTNSGIFILILFLRLMSDHILVPKKSVANNSMVTGTCPGNDEWTEIMAVYLYTVWTVLFLSVNIGALYYVFREQELWKVLGFMLPPVWEPNVWMLLWVVVLTDFILKFVTVILKSLITMLPAFCILQKRKGKYFMFIEHTMQLYRSLLPVLPWTHFLLDEQTSGKWLFGGFLLLVYGLIKLYMILMKAKDIKNALTRLRVDLIYGTKPSSEELHANGENCPICQDDYKEPVMLNCKIGPSFNDSHVLRFSHILSGSHGLWISVPQR